jgi:hypothetical protein
VSSWSDLSLRLVPEEPGARERLLQVGSAVAILLVAGAVVSDPGGFSWIATASLVILSAFAAHREAIYADETALSGSIVVICACIVGLGEASFVPPVLCGVAAALHRDHVRERQFLKVSVNVCATVVPAFVATLLFRSFGASAAEQIVSVVCAVGTYWLVNNAIVGTAIGLTYRRWRSTVVQLIRSDTVMLVFGFGGALCGIVMVEIGVGVGFAALVALLVALDVFVISVPAGLVDMRAAWAMVLTRGVSGGVAGTVSAVVTRAVSVSVLGAFAGLAAGVFAGCAVVAVVVALRLYLKHGRADAATVGGIVLVETVVPIIAAISGVVAVLASVEAALVVGASLVVAASVVVAVRRHRAAKIPRVMDEDVLMGAVVEALAEGLPARER